MFCVISLEKLYPESMLSLQWEPVKQIKKNVELVIYFWKLNLLVICIFSVFFVKFILGNRTLSLYFL